MIPRYCQILLASEGGRDDGWEETVCVVDGGFTRVYRTWRNHYCVQRKAPLAYHDQDAWVAAKKEAGEELDRLLRETGS